MYSITSFSGIRNSFYIFLCLCKDAKTWVYVCFISSTWTWIFMKSICSSIVQVPGLAGRKKECLCRDLDVDPIYGIIFSTIFLNVIKDVFHFMLIDTSGFANNQLNGVRFFFHQFHIFYGQLVDIYGITLHHIYVALFVLKSYMYILLNIKCTVFSDSCKTVSLFHASVRC